MNHHQGKRVEGGTTRIKVLREGVKRGQGQILTRRLLAGKERENLGGREELQNHLKGQVKEEENLEGATVKKMSEMIKVEERKHLEVK